MWLMVTLRVGGVGVLSVLVGAFSDGDAVSDGDFFGSDEDVYRFKTPVQLDGLLFVGWVRPLGGIR
jgi:hypothetical protein